MSNSKFVYSINGPEFWKAEPYFLHEGKWRTHNNKMHAWRLLKYRIDWRNIPASYHPESRACMISPHEVTNNELYLRIVIY
jgi:hypothetical protein